MSTSPVPAAWPGPWLPQAELAPSLRRGTGEGEGRHLVKSQNWERTWGDVLASERNELKGGPWREKRTAC